MGALAAPTAAHATAKIIQFPNFSRGRVCDSEAYD